MFAKRLNILQEVTFWLKMCGYIRVCVCVWAVSTKDTDLVGNSERLDVHGIGNQ